MDDICLFTYSHKDYSDVWPAYIGQMAKFLPTNLTHRFFANEGTFKPISDNWLHIHFETYNEGQSYRKRLLECLYQIPEKFIIFSHEDFILYDHVDVDSLKLYIAYLMEFQERIYGIKLVKGGKGPFVKVDHERGLFINTKGDYIFAIQPTIWDRHKLISLLEECESDSIWQLEIEASKKLKSKGIQTVLTAYRGGNKRGMMHWDSKILPFIATAVVKGKWNIAEYKDILPGILKEYDIDPMIRGTNET